MNSPEVQSVLAQIGFSDGYHMPIANEENVKLEHELQKLILKKAKATSTLQNIHTKKDGLEKHLKFVKSEQIENQNILFARNTELENEKHQYTILKMEREREQQEIRRMSNEEKNLEQQKKHKLLVLKDLMTKMEAMKAHLKWDERAIDSLEEIVAKKDEDNQTIQKFTKEDLRKVEDFEVKRRRLREEELSRKGLVVRLANEIENMELTIGRNVQMYRQMCEERNTMVEQWQGSVKQLQQRNKDIVNLQLEIEAVKELNTLYKNINLEEQRQFAENERKNNFELEQKIEVENAFVARTRNMVKNISAQIKDFKAELDYVQRDLRITATTLDEQRAERKFFIEFLTTQETYYEKTQQSVERLKKHLKQVENSNLSAEDRIRQLEEMVQNEEKTHDMLLNDIERIQGVIFRSQSVLADLKEVYKNKLLKQKVEENSLITLQKKKAQLEIEMKNSAETIYKLHFRINMLENRMARATGERTDDMGEIHQLRLRELKIILQGVTDTSNLLQVQITKLEDDMRRMSMATTANNEILENLRACLNDRVLMVEGGVKMVKRQQAVNNSRKVDLNVLAVRLKGADNTVQTEKDVVYNLQRQQMALEAACRERMAEVLVERDLLFSKRRALQDDAGRMRGDIQLRKIRIEQLKKRLECILESLGKSEDGEALSVTYFRVKNAQEKYALQQEGDRLDKLIKKSEEEIIALENTLKCVNDTNKSYKRSLDALEEDAIELKAFKALEEQYKEIGIELRARTKVLNERSVVMRDLRAKIDEVRGKVDGKDGLAEIIQEKQKKLNNILTEETERKTKINRAIAATADKDRVCACVGDYFIDLATRQYREVNKSALQQLLEVSIRNLETEPLMKKYMSENQVLHLFKNMKPRYLKLGSSSSSSSSSGTPKSTTSRTRSSSQNSKDPCTEKLPIPTVLFTLNIP